MISSDYPAVFNRRHCADVPHSRRITSSILYKHTATCCLGARLTPCRSAAAFIELAAGGHRLEAALWADTAFLAGLGVMDYSLLVGIDRDASQLVVGIIDFVRQVRPTSDHAQVKAACRIERSPAMLSSPELASSPPNPTATSMSMPLPDAELVRKP